MSGYYNTSEFVALMILAFGTFALGAIFFYYSAKEWFYSKLDQGGKNGK